jgi:hypothetical protein
MKLVSIFVPGALRDAVEYVNEKHLVGNAVQFVQQSKEEAYRIGDIEHRTMTVHGYDVVLRVTEQHAKTIAEAIKEKITEEHKSGLDS